MKTSTVLSRPLLLVALLAVSWAAGAPLQDAPENDNLKELLEEFFDKNPAIAQDLYPDLVNEASVVDLTVDQDVVVDLLRNYVRELTVEEIEDELEREAESEEDQEGDHERRKRQTSISGGLHGSRNPFGRSIGGTATVNHAWDNGRHSLSGTLGGTRHTVKGLGSANSYSSGIGYNFSPNKRTSIGISAHKNWGAGGSSHGIGLSFSHKFGR